MKWIWKMCNCTEIFSEKKKPNFVGEPFEKNTRHHPWFLPQCTNPGRNWSSGPATQLLLEEKPVAGAALLCSESCSFPGGVRAPHIPAWPQSWRVRLPCFLPRTALLSISPFDSDSQPLLFYIQTLLSLLYSKITTAEQAGIHPSIVQAFFFNT